MNRGYEPDPLDKAEHDAMEHARLRAWVPGTWSDWFEMTADCLALLYHWRGRQEGKTVEEWLTGLIAHSSDMSMKASVKWRVDKLPANESNNPAR